MVELLLVLAKVLGELDRTRRTCPCLLQVPLGLVELLLEAGLLLEEQRSLPEHQGDEHRVYSLIANRAYRSQYTLVFENGESMPEKDSMSVYPTLVNGFPNLFVDLDLKDAPSFLVDLKAVASKADWSAFKKRYGILRNSQAFWPFYDWINAWNFAQRGELAGWLDLTYYDAPEI